MSSRSRSPARSRGRSPHKAKTHPDRSGSRSRSRYRGRSRDRTSSHRTSMPIVCPLNNKKGGCKTARCNLAHPSLYNKECRWYKTATGCRNGNACLHLHYTPTLRPKTPPKPALVEKPPAVTVHVPADAAPRAPRPARSRACKKWQLSVLKRSCPGCKCLSYVLAKVHDDDGANNCDDCGETVSWVWFCKKKCGEPPEEDDDQ